jgi:hypothetical protein
VAGNLWRFTIISRRLALLRKTVKCCPPETEIRFECLRWRGSICRTGRNSAIRLRLTLRQSTRYHDVPAMVGAVGIRPTPSALSIFALFGLSDLFGLVVRPNKTQITRAIYEKNAARWRSFWPELRIADSLEADGG